MTQHQFTERRIPLGRVVITLKALKRLDRFDACEGLHHRAGGDWRELDQQDLEKNQLSIKEGFRLRSAYEDRNGTRFWIITEADRTGTTILLPEDY